MLLARRLAVATASLLIAAGLFFSAGDSAAEAASGNCADAAELAVLPSPLAPWKGAPLRVMVVTEKPVEGTLSLIAPDGSVAAKSPDRHDGPPYSWFAEVAAPAAGTWHATLTLDHPPAECSAITRDIVVSARKPPPPHTPAGSFWQVRNSWNIQTENLFSAWIEKLFDAPPDQELSWKVWNEVLRDRSRNFLFNYLGRGEDKLGSGLRPDCADFVYFLRAYFAYKMGLPFGYSNCSRGIAGKPPKCAQWFDIEHPELTRPPPPPEAGHRIGHPRRRHAARPRRACWDCLPAASGRAAGESTGHSAPPPKPKRPTKFGEYLRDVGDVVHTGAVRVAANDDNTDFYTVPLTQQALRPGTVYADPYGHVLMLVHRVPESNGTPGVFLAVDAEPDGSITRKRFWRGNFLFVHDPALGSPGFKHFRPIMRDKNGPLRRLTNAEIAKNPQYGDFSLEQSQMSGEDFYDRMDDVMSPEPLDPVKAMTDAIASLKEQVKTRVTSVENGRKYQEKERRRDRHAERRLDLRDDRRLGGLLDAGARFPAADRDRCGARVSRSLRTTVGALFDAGRQEHRGREERIAGRARLRARRAQDFLYPQRRLAVDAVAQGRGRSGRKSGDGLQPERLRRAAVGGARKAARRHRPASGTRRRRSAPRCRRSTAAGSRSGTGRPMPDQCNFGLNGCILRDASLRAAPRGLTRN